MKKVLTIIITLCLIMNLSACNKKEENVGGWSDVKDSSITAELKEKFDEACVGYTGMSFEPIELLKTQVVAGTKYKFLCNGTTVTPNGETKKVVVTIYEDLNGKLEITSVEDYTE